MYTIKKARKIGIWPRKQRDEETVKPDREVKGGGSGKDTPGTTSASGLSSIQATGKPSLAVRSVMDDLRKLNIDRISKMRIESSDDVFPMLSLVGRIREIEASLKMTGDYETDTGGRLDVEFNGTLKDSEPVLEFLKPQLLKASVGNVCVTLDIDFKDGANIDWLETFANRLRLVDNEIEVSGIVGAVE